MLSNVFNAQQRNTLKGDWIEVVRKDLLDFSINDSFDEISRKKEDSFKKEVTKACKKFTFNMLMKEKQKREKGENLHYKNLEIQSYLLNEKFKYRDAIFLFKIRTEMLDVRKNFSHKFMNNMTCQACNSHTDTQQGILECSALNSVQTKIKYSDLFSTDLNVLEGALNKYKVLWKKREKLFAEK